MLLPRRLREGELRNIGNKHGIGYDKLIVFMLGSCSTFSIHLGLMYVNWWDMLFTHAMSLVGGVVSAVIVAWLQQRWKERGKIR